MTVTFAAAVLGDVVVEVDMLEVDSVIEEVLGEGDQGGQPAKQDTGEDRDGEGDTERSDLERALLMGSAALVDRFRGSASAGFDQGEQVLDGLGILVFVVGDRCSVDCRADTAEDTGPAVEVLDAAGIVEFDSLLG